MKIQGRQQYLWRAVDEDGDVLDILRGSESARGAGSSPPPIWNASRRGTASSRISSGSAATSCGQVTTVS